MACWAGVALLMALVVRFGADAGVTPDEPLHADYGRRVLGWFYSGFTNRAAMDFANLYLYGGLFDAGAQLVVRASPVGPYETRHFLTAFMALVGIVGTGATAARIGGPRSGFLAGMILALTPAWIGHGLFNPKDVPFGAFAALATYGAVRIATGRLPIRWPDSLLAAIAVGLALAVRPGGIFLLGYPIAAAGLLVVETSWRRREPSATGWLRVAGGAALRVLPILPISWLLMLSAWPWAQLAPLSRPLTAIAAATRFPWNGETLFAGSMVSAQDLPASYLPTWFAITTPELYGVALALGVLSLTRVGPVNRPASRGLVALALSLLTPVAGVLVTRPVLYDGLRHLLFLFPPLAAMAGVSVAAFLSADRISRWMRVVGVALFLGACLTTLVDIVSLHPYQYAYFNRTFGGLPAAVGRYETDYWGASYKEGLAWVVSEWPAVPGQRPTGVSSCNDNSNLRLEYYGSRWPGAADAVVIGRAGGQTDVYLAMSHDDCPRPAGEIVHTVERQGAPLLYVIRTAPRGTAVRD